MRSKKINLVVVPLLLTACSHNDGPLVQDVYNNQYDCARDWNNETCKQENSSSGHGSSYVGSRYLGPAYYQNNRKFLITKYLTSLQQFECRPTSYLKYGEKRVFFIPNTWGFGRSGFSFGG